MTTPVPSNKRPAVPFADATIAAVERARALLAANPAPSMQTLIDAAASRIRAEQGDDAALPRSLTALQNAETVERLSRDGLTVREIANHTGLSESWIYKLRSRAGLSRSRIARG